MIWVILSYSLAMTAVFSVMTAALSAPHHAWGAAFGGLLMTLNLGVLVWAWKRIIFKKSIALAVPAIVFKYAILAGIIYLVLQSPRISNFGFAIGLVTVVPTMTLFAFKAQRGQFRELKAKD